MKMDSKIAYLREFKDKKILPGLLKLDWKHNLDVASERPKSVGGMGRGSFCYNSKGETSKDKLPFSWSSPLLKSSGDEECARPSGEQWTNESWPSIHTTRFRST